MTIYEYSQRPKATYKGKVRDKNGYAVHLFFEYRGHEYMITDEHNGYSVPMHKKHQYEQARIDMLIEMESKPKKPFDPADTCEAAFDKLWNYFETGVFE